MMARFIPLRLKGEVNGQFGVGLTGIKYKVVERHLRCLTSALLTHVVESTPFGQYFNDEVYFHPNVRTDGWVEFQAWYQGVRDTHPTLHRSPTSPRFWESNTLASETTLWPPSLFDPWVIMVRDGVRLQLDPAPNPTAAPSTSTHIPEIVRTDRSDPPESSHSPSVPNSTPAPAIPPTLPSPPPFPTDQPDLEGGQSISDKGLWDKMPALNADDLEGLP